MQITTYKVRIKLLERMLGTVPHDKEIYSKFIASKAADLGLAEEEVETVESLEGKGWTGFHKDDEGHFLYSYMLKAFLKETARTFKTHGTTKQLQDKFTRYAFVAPRRVRIPAPAGTLERPLRAQTAMGPRVCLVKSDYVEAGAEIEFNVEVLDGGGISRQCLEDVLSYGRLMGLAQWRSGGFGNFEVLSVEEV